MLLLFLYAYLSYESISEALLEGQHLTALGAL